MHFILKQFEFKPFGVFIFHLSRSSLWFWTPPGELRNVDSICQGQDVAYQVFSDSQIVNTWLWGCAFTPGIHKWAFATFKWLAVNITSFLIQSQMPTLHSLPYQFWKVQFRFFFLSASFYLVYKKTPFHLLLLFPKSILNTSSVANAYFQTILNYPEIPLI